MLIVKDQKHLTKERNKIKGNNPKSKKRKAKSRKIPKPHISFRIPIYGGEVRIFCKKNLYEKAYYLLLGENTKEAAKTTTLGCATHLVGPQGESIYLVGWFNQEAATLIHELLHVAIFTLKHVGINLGSSNGEPLCYLLDSFMDSVGITDAKRSKI